MAYEATVPVHRRLLWSAVTDPERLLGAVPNLVVEASTEQGVAARLRLLGASHQVLAWAEEETALLCVETVACLPGLAEPLPPRHLLALPGGGYEWSAETFALSGAEFDRAVERVRRSVEANPHALGGYYPGAPGALTAVLPEPAEAGVRWTTWHSYPQDEIGRAHV